MAEKVLARGFLLSYGGPALAGGSIDVRDLGPALLSVGDLFEEANSVAGGRTNVSVHVQATRRGSFEVLLEIVQPLLPIASDMIRGVRPEHLITYMFGEARCKGEPAGLRGLLELIRVMRGAPLPPDPEEQSRLGRRSDSGIGQSSRAETLSEELREPQRQSPEQLPVPTQFNITIHGNPNITIQHFYNNPKIRKSVDGMTKPLATPGIQEMTISDGQSEDPFIVIPKADRELLRVGRKRPRRE